MRLFTLRLALLLALLLPACPYVRADELPALHVEGRYLCLPDGTPINLHGFGQIR